MRSRRSSWLALSLLVAGCAAPRSLPQLFAGRPAARAGAITVAIASDLRWPVRLHEVRLALDGQRVRENAPVPAVEGDHAVAMRAELRWPCSVAGSEARVLVTDMVALDLGARGAEVQLAVLARGNPFDRPEQRFTVQHRVLGHVRSHISRDQFTRFEDLLSGECRARTAPEDALCRVQSRLQRAREQRDIIQVNCQVEKLASLRLIVERAVGAPLSQDALDRVAGIERESRECRGESISYFAGPTVTVVQACEGEDEAPPP
ncbi:MAG: hypothetical protein U0269_38505 [Polyangiales bacterium]